MLTASKPNLLVSGALWNKETVLALWKMIDCKGCWHCCENCKPILVQGYEVERIAAFLGVKAKKLKHEWKADFQWHLPSPCPFRSEQGCAIYPARPVVCKFYPLQRINHNGHEVVGVFSECGAGEKCIEMLQGLEVAR